MTVNNEVKGINEVELENLIKKLKQSLEKINDLEFFFEREDEDKVRQRTKEIQTLIEEVEKALRNKL